MARADSGGSRTMPKRVTKWGIFLNGRRHGKHHLMSERVAKEEARWLSNFYGGEYEARPIRETVKSGYRARNRRSARTEAYLRRE